MARVYSSRLLLEAGLGGGSGDLAIPPAGFVWVVRHITAYYAALNSTALAGFVISVNDTAPMWALRGPQLSGLATYDWAGRHVITADDTWTFTSDDGASWALMASGYTLSLP